MLQCELQQYVVHRTLDISLYICCTFTFSIQIYFIFNLFFNFRNYDAIMMDATLPHFPQILPSGSVSQVICKSGKWKIVDFPDSPLLHWTTPLSFGLSAFDYAWIGADTKCPPFCPGRSFSLNSLGYKCHIPLWPCCRPLMRRQCDKDLILL